MKYSEFEDIISQQRMRKYLQACNNDSKKAMTLYRYNLKLSQGQLLYIPGAWLHQQVTQSYRSSWAYLFQPTKCCYWHILCPKPICSHDATIQLDGYRWCFINVWTWPCRQRMQQNNVLIIDFRKKCLNIWNIQKLFLSLHRWFPAASDLSSCRVCFYWR